MIHTRLLGRQSLNRWSLGRVLVLASAARWIAELRLLEFSFALFPLFLPRELLILRNIFRPLADQELLLLRFGRLGVICRLQVSVPLDQCCCNRSKRNVIFQTIEDGFVGEVGIGNQLAVFGGIFRNPTLQLDHDSRIPVKDGHKLADRGRDPLHVLAREFGLRHWQALRVLTKQAKAAGEREDGTQKSAPAETERSVNCSRFFIVRHFVVRQSISHVSLTSRQAHQSWLFSDRIQDSRLRTLYRLVPDIDHGPVIHSAVLLRR